MKKNNMLLGTLLISGFAFSQVGVGTNLPKATLDVMASPTDATKTDGFIAPRLKGSELKAKDALYDTPQTGAIVYVTEALLPAATTTKTVNVTAVGYFYFDGAVWQKVGSGTTSAIEPWYEQNTTNQATSNIQDIYQSGSVAIGKNVAYAGANAIKTNFDVEGSLRGGTSQTGNVGTNSFAFGNGNEASGLRSISMGMQNVNKASNSAIFGGSGNNISYDDASQPNVNSVIVGGQNNTNTGNITSIFGGYLNKILTTSLNGSNSVIVGGFKNTLDATNTNMSMSGAGIVGGSGNTIKTGSGIDTANSTIIGGSSGTILNSHSSILGGQAGKITSQYSALLGGNGLISGSFGETVLGQYNAITTGTVNYGVLTDPVFQIGNGTADTFRSNAITVLKNGNTGIVTTTPTEKLDNNGITRLRNLPANGAVNAIYNQSNGTASTTQNQTFTATKTVVADANGVLGYVAGLPAAMPIIIAGADGADAVTNTKTIQQKNSVGNATISTLLTTKTFTLAQKSLVTISYNVTVTDVYAFDGSILKDGSAKKLGAFVNLDGNGISANGATYTNFTSGMFLDGIFYLQNTRTIVMNAGSHTIDLYGEVFAGATDSIGVKATFGAGMLDQLDITAFPIQ